MSFEDLLTRMIGRLERAGVPYMLVGSVASSMFGEPRATRDIDIVIDPTDRQLRALVAEFETEGYYVDLAAALEAREQRAQFNVIDVSTGLKVDFVIRKDRPFSREEFRRRQQIELAGVLASVATPEDTIISKLEWARAGDSERQLRDAASIVAIEGDRLDRRYLERWISELALEELWAAAQR